MGTTTTTNLQLIKPDVNESIKQSLPTYAGWASQNATNQDKIDAVFRNNTGAYTPSWTAVTTSPVLGTGGFVEGKYARLFPRMVIVYFKIYVGTTGFTPGTGQYRITAPFPFDPIVAYFSELVPVGKASFFDASSQLTSQACGVYYKASDGLIYIRPTNGDIWSATVPVVPAANDKMSGYFMYPTAAA